MKGNSSLKIMTKADITQIALTPELSRRKLEKILYTIRREDYRKLNRKGVLTVYNIKEPIEIPVTRLLGKWKKNHIGITVFKLNEEWQIEGEHGNHIINTQPSFIVILKRALVKYKGSLYLLEKLVDRRINKDDLIKN